jgi:hypothetical protein
MKDPRQGAKPISIGASYFGNRILRHVATDMEDLAERGFTGVLHAFSENDLYYYRDHMRRIVEVSHQAGLEVQIPEVAEFREASPVGFVRELVGYFAGQGARSTVCLLPLTEGPLELSDWSVVASISGLDTLATDPYWKAFGQPARDFVGGFARLVSDLGEEHDVNGQIWIQGFGLGPEDADDIRAAVEAARGTGVGDLWTWGYEACGHMDHLGTREPEKVWAVLTEALTGHTVARE